MNLEVTGDLIAKYDTQVVSDKFKKREFVLELSEQINGFTYTNYAKMQLVQAKCDLIDRFNVGDKVKASFNIKGSKYEKDGKVSYFTNLDVWRIEPATEGVPAQATNMPQNNAAPNTGYAGNYTSGNAMPANPANAMPDISDDLPF